MKIKVILLAFVLLALASCSAQADRITTADAREIASIIEESAPSSFGYCDVSEYYEESFFDDMSDLLQCYVFKCNESTNFNEFGIFEFESPSDAKKNEIIIKNYLVKSRQDFENGIIYNTAEYPKFKNATLRRYGNFVIYTILNSDEADKAYSEISNYINQSKA